MNSSVSQLRSYSPGPAPQEPASSVGVTVSPQLIMLSDPSNPAAESIRHLRTRLVAQHLNHGRRALALCTAGPASGCSFTAGNLAIAFAQTGVRVLLINADMRGAGLDEMFGEFAAGDGLAHYLSSHVTKPDQVVETEIVENLWFTPAGAVAGDAQELLSSPRFESFVNISVRQFDLVLIDTPPATHYADAQRIAAVAGFAVIIGRRNRTYTQDVALLSSQLATDGVSVVGTILNDHR